MALPFRHKVVIKSTLRVSILKNNGGEAKPKFQNLMDDDSSHCDMNRPLTDHEKHLLIHKNYEAFVHEQKSYDADLKVKLAQQEEDLRAEEEAFYEAKREAARIAKLQRAKEQQARTRNATTHGVKSWLGDDENDWEVGGGEDDFEMFLASVKARSLSARAWLRHGSGDAPSSNSSQTKEKSQNSSSIDLEWDHEADVMQEIDELTDSDEHLYALPNKFHRTSPTESDDFVWDNDFVCLTNSETEQLLESDRNL